MTDFTIWGVAARIGQAAEEWGPLGRIGQHAFLDLNSQLGGAEIDCDHDAVAIGSIVYAEVGVGGEISLVGVVDAPLDAITEREIFFSPTYRMVGPADALSQRSYVAREATLLGASLTFSPSTVAALPTRHIAGDVRSPLSRSGWPLGWRSSFPLLGRAVDHLGDDRHVEQRTAHRVIDRRADDGAPSGPLWHRPGGRVLSVR